MLDSRFRGNDKTKRVTFTGCPLRRDCFSVFLPSFRDGFCALFLLPRGCFHASFLSFRGREAEPGIQDCHPQNTVARKDLHGFSLCQIFLVVCKHSARIYPLTANMQSKPKKFFG
ncbi:MAG: hypothetical protein AXA67_02295 [Methylothermaceae bacteria B42]|nr:MAG: hypothetical protein AXA67_02295 [Methylothermaceae bacteria B42]